MNNFKLKLITPSISDIKSIGTDPCYLESAIKQHRFKSIKIYGLSCAQANILKQTAISCGTDCTVHRETITGKIDSTDCILSGSLREFEKLADKLSHQPLKLKMLGEELLTLSGYKPAAISINQQNFDWSKPYIMGILNITPDSFSDGGCFNTIEKALKRATEMIEEGADIIDIGGESTRPYAKPVSVEEEIKRVLPVIETLRERYPHIVISLDTRNAKTAELGIQSGANIINDISGGEWDPEMFKICAKYKTPIIINHSQGTPQNMQNNPHYTNCIDEIYEYLKKRAEIAKSTGVEQIIIDPGIGFGKTVKQNFEIINNAEQFISLGYPVLIGHSRKSFLKEALKTQDRFELDTATAILSKDLIQKGINILRVHNIKSHQTYILGLSGDFL